MQILLVPFVVIGIVMALTVLSRQSDMGSAVYKDAGNATYSVLMDANTKYKIASNARVDFNQRVESVNACVVMLQTIRRYATDDGVEQQFGVKVDTFLDRCLKLQSSLQRNLVRSTKKRKKKKTP